MYDARMSVSDGDEAVVFSRDRLDLLRLSIPGSVEAAYEIDGETEVVKFTVEQLDREPVCGVGEFAHGECCVSAAVASDDALYFGRCLTHDQVPGRCANG